MKNLLKRVLFSFLLLSSGLIVRAQDDVQTRENALAREREAKAQKQAEYDAHHKHIQEIQGKKVQKRMKKNLKKSQRISQGKQIPWYKRIFRRKRIR